MPLNIGMIGRLEFGKDKPGKDTNFRGLTIFNNTLYISKGSGGNGINTVYQVGSQGTLPTGTAAQLATVPITILPGFPNTAASTSTAFTFGLWFADANALYVCDEGDGTYVTPSRERQRGGRSIAGHCWSAEMALGERNLDDALRSARRLEYRRAVRR